MCFTNHHYKLATGRNNVREQLMAILCDFKRIPAFCEAHQWQDIEFEFYEAPHSPPSPLLENQRAVYLFFREEEWLRIGQTGYSPRFTSQHYGTRRAGSTFAKDIWENRQEFGFSDTEENVGTWIMQNCGRANIRLPIGWPKEVSPLLESYLHYRLRPRFEGTRRRSGD